MIHWSFIQIAVEHKYARVKGFICFRINRVEVISLTVPQIFHQLFRQSIYPKPL